jgi:hypothetical protein
VPDVKKWLLMARITAGAVRTRWRSRFGMFRTTAGAMDQSVDTSKAVAYIERVFADYCKYADLGDSWFENKSVLELGPGDNLGIALLFIAAGAREVVCLDQFYCLRDNGRERLIYLELRKRLPADRRARFDQAVNLENGLEFQPERIRSIYGTGAQQATDRLAGQKFDVIISRSVLEEVDKVDQAFRVMDSMLAPGGWMIHQIDMSDYGMFSSRGFHPLEFLTIPAPVYRMMTRSCSKPNRHLTDFYRKQMSDLGYEAKLIRTHVLAEQGYLGAPLHDIHPPVTELTPGLHYQTAHQELVKQIRPRLQPEYRDLTEQDLLTASAFLVARKSLLAK